ncbi:MAG: hypothetical protein K2P81_01825 [Bacteriovoracaceae bacterium]|nr:hypothetical protein [Bacteriovoracaceae bacterium]
MEVRELIAAARHMRPWALLLFSFIAFQSLKNANPPEISLAPQQVLLAQR